MVRPSLVEIARKARESRGPVDALLGLLHPKQRAFVEDRSRSKAALCSRRAGKSFGVAADLLLGGFADPGGLSVYIARSKGDARRILEPALRFFDRTLSLGLHPREVDGQLHWVLPNGHVLWLAGCKDQSEAGKFRGSPYSKAVVEEAQEYAANVLHELVTDVLEPALVDKKGSLVLVGTPHPIPAGFFYESTTGDGGPLWPTHHWTILDNPFLQDALEELERIRKKNHWDETHPTYRREWCGEWVLDTGALVYPYSGALNAFTPEDRELLESVDPSELVWALAADIGAGEKPSSAFAVGCIRRGFPHVYIVSCDVVGSLIPSTFAARIERYRAERKLSSIVVDAGGLGVGYVGELQQRYGIPCEPAAKAHKRAFQEVVGGDLRSGVVKVDPYAARPLIDEWNLLQWNEERTEADPRFPDHCSDAALYLTRALRPHYRPVENEPEKGSAEWYRRESARAKAAAAAEVKRRVNARLKRRR